VRLGRCDTTGLDKPECSCRPCTLAVMRKHGTAQLQRILGGDDGQAPASTPGNGGSTPPASTPRSGD